MEEIPITLTAEVATIFGQVLASELGEMRGEVERTSFSPEFRKSVYGVHYNEHLRSVLDGYSCRQREFGRSK